MDVSVGSRNPRPENWESPEVGKAAFQLRISQCQTTKEERSLARTPPLARRPDHIQEPLVAGNPTRKPRTLSRLHMHLAAVKVQHWKFWQLNPSTAQPFRPRILEGLCSSRCVLQEAYGRAPVGVVITELLKHAVEQTVDAPVPPVAIAKPRRYHLGVRKPPSFY